MALVIVDSLETRLQKERGRDKVRELGKEDSVRSDLLMEEKEFYENIQTLEFSVAGWVSEETDM